MSESVGLILADFKHRLNDTRLGSLLMQHLFDDVQKNDAIRLIRAHVQSNNQDAMRFYERFGFVRKHTIDNYYRRIRPSSCVVFEKVLREAEK